jgi:hypothetical protein
MSSIARIISEGFRPPAASDGDKPDGFPEAEFEFCQGLPLAGGGLLPLAPGGAVLELPYGLEARFAPGAIGCVPGSAPPR